MVDVRPYASIVIPYHEAQQPLRMTLSALGMQSVDPTTYEVVVADDGSRPHVRPEVPSGLPYHVRTVAHERRGARRGTTRNLGSAEARGEVLVFLDADMVPDRRWLEAHLQHHDDNGCAVVIGDRLHVAEEYLTDAKLRALLRNPAGLIAVERDTRTVRPEWRGAIIRDTGGLTAPGSRGWRVAGGGNLSLRRGLFDRIGGFSDDFEGWGGEDLEFAYRAGIAGANFLWEPVALALHIGLQATPSHREEAELAANERLLADRVPDPTLRRRFPVRPWSVPRVLVEISDGIGSPHQTCAVIDEVLAAETDVVVHVRSTEPSTRDAVQGAYAADGRIVVGSDTAASATRWSPIRGQVFSVDLSSSEIRAAISFVTPEATGGHVAARVADGDHTRAIFHSVPLTNAGATAPVATVPRAPKARAHPSTGAGDDLDVQALRNVYWRMPSWLRRLIFKTIAITARLGRLRSRARRLQTRPDAGDLVP